MHAVGYTEQANQYFKKNNPKYNQWFLDVFVSISLFHSFAATGNILLQNVIMCGTYLLGFTNWITMRLGVNLSSSQSKKREEKKHSINIWKMKSANTCWCTAYLRLVCQQSGGWCSRLPRRTCCQCKPTCPRTPDHRNTWEVSTRQHEFIVVSSPFSRFVKRPMPFSHRMIKARDSLGASLFRKNLSPSKTFFWASCTFCSFSLASMFSMSSWRKKKWK